MCDTAPVLAVLDYDCCNYSGSFFYPQEDGRKYWGTRFVFTPMANGANQQFVFARDPSVVRVFDSTGTQIAVSPTLSAGQRWQIPSVVPNATYAVQSEPPAATTSAALIAIMASSGNGNTQVPPVAREAQGLRNDCNTDRGVEFFFATYAWQRGSLAVFNAGSSAITFSLETVTGGALANTAGYQNITVAANSAFLNTAANGFASLGTAQYRLVSTGPVTVWADGKINRIATPPVQGIRDTTGAGDSFNAGYLAARLLEQPPDQAVAAGQRFSGMVIQHFGARLPSAMVPVLA